MKKKILVLVVVVCLCLPALVWAQLGGLLGKKPEPKVDVDGLSARSVAIMGLVQKATISFAEGVVAIQEACGKKEEAEKLKQNIANLKSNPNKNTTGVLISSANEATANIEKDNSIAQINAEEARKFMALSILNVGVAVYLDGIAAKDGAVLLKDAQGAMKQVSPTLLPKVKDVVDVGQFVGQEVPPQAASMKTFSGKLIEYAKTKGIPIPSPEDIEKKAKEVGRE